jgi:hypothetical protein
MDRTAHGPRSSGDRAPPSGGGSAGSNPAGGAQPQVSDLRLRHVKPAACTKRALAMCAWLRVIVKGRAAAAGASCPGCRPRSSVALAARSVAARGIRATSAKVVLPWHQSTTSCRVSPSSSANRTTISPTRCSAPRTSTSRTRTPDRAAAAEEVVGAADHHRAEQRRGRDLAAHSHPVGPPARADPAGPPRRRRTAAARRAGSPALARSHGPPRRQGGRPHPRRRRLARRRAGLGRTQRRPGQAACARAGYTYLHSVVDGPPLAYTNHCRTRPPRPRWRSWPGPERSSPPTASPA